MVSSFTTTTSMISVDSMDELRAEGARNPFGDPDNDDDDFEYSSLATISVSTQIFLRLNHHHARMPTPNVRYIKPVALCVTDLIILADGPGGGL